MPAGAIASRLSDEQVAEVLELTRGADSVELKLTVPAADQLSAVTALGMDPLEAQIRQVFFFDTPDLDLYDAGVVVRARRVQRKGDDSVVKLRPVVPDELPAKLRESPDFGVEVDAMPGGFVCSGTMKQVLSKPRVKEVVQGGRAISKLFSKDQRALFAEHAPDGIDLDGLSVLGPIFVLKLKFSPGGHPRRLVAEMWLYPDNSRLLELSTKCAPSEAFQVAAEERAYLTEHGVSLEGEQETKTRKALEFFSGQLEGNVNDETSKEPEKRSRRWLPITLIVVASVLAVVSIFAIWAKRQLLETDTWVETSTELLENETISNAIADYAVEELFSNVDVQGELQNRLPPIAQPLAAPIAGGLRQLADQAAREALQQPKVQALWEQINRTAHESLLKVIDDEGEFVSSGGGVVTLDLRAVVAEVATQVGLPSDLAAKLPAGTAQLEILRSDELETVQSGVDLFRTLGYVVVIVTLLLYALAIYLAGDRRREALRSVGFAFIVVGALVLFAHSAAGNAITNSLADTPAAEPPVRATWEIGTSLLKEGGQAIVGYGIVIVLAAWLAGPTGIATALRGAIAPYYRRPGVALGALVALLLLVFWWNPTAGTSRLLPSLILIFVLALGMEMLRRRIIREFPDRVTPSSSEGIAQRIAGRMQEARERRVAGESGAATAAPPAEADRVSQLERLAKLHEAGTLSDEEFAAEKQRVLSSS